MPRRNGFGIRAALVVAVTAFTASAVAQAVDTLDTRLDALEAQVVAAEDVAAITSSPSCTSSPAVEPRKGGGARSPCSAGTTATRRGPKASTR
jgi:hypothetical protein